MARTTSTLVQGLLAGEYDVAAATDLTPYIALAGAIVDQVVVCMAAKGLAAASATVLELIERTAAALSCASAAVPSLGRVCKPAQGHLRPPFLPLGRYTCLPYP